ncbi:hypothetical protein Calab_0832 [Caldithrix abyssi DSM 13497]|uniref:Por secretion system C-terminal sorting domain-containing protein n=1 Tax=Caldithrix abyssi DSM 13497 TaxID=880073 RepID=H1XU27_CALAY|nr:YCF48-related protein [Caldithrix abyssi]APF16880.1 Por secretion system C-terminal sorting domain-containing protein [Caldithrix abyssi DSM 13497]EHO40470.1 hypothetical protein Calab_0832 [Caldithrix abyssi DSM 13497]
MNKEIQYIVLLVLLMFIKVYSSYKWIKIREIDIDVQAVFFADTASGWIVGNENQTGKIFKTFDGGYTWILVDFINGVLNDIYFIDENNGWAIGHDMIYNKGIVLKTINRGINWKRIRLPYNVYLKRCQFLDSNSGWMIYNMARDTIFYTNNGGEDWEVKKIGSNKKIFSFDFVSEDTGWVCCSEGNIYKSVDGGNNWINQKIPIDWPVLVIDFLNNKLGWCVTGNSAAFLQTKDGGKNWDILLESMTPCGIFSFLFMDHKTGWACGCNEIFHTTDGGYRWIREIEVSVYLKDIFFVDSLHGWSVGDKTILKTIPTDTLGTFVVNSPSNNINTFLLKQNFPNPFNSSTVIRYKITKVSYVTINIFNFSGQKIRSLVSKKYIPGNYSITWDGTNDYGQPVSSGVYYYQIRFNDKVESKKMILIR